MVEPSLWAMRTERAHERYRFLWLRTWSRPVSIRFELGDQPYLVVRVLGGTADHPGTAILDQARALSSEEVGALKCDVEAAAFWTTSPEELGPWPGRFRDGTEWIVEGARAGDYHVVERTSPDVKTDERQLRSFALLCREAFDLAHPAGESSDFN